ncbi:hypothetical protein STEG23_006605 [Scotinomys teguina]
MSLSFLFLLFSSHLILSAWAHGEKRLTPEGQPAAPRNPGDSSRSQGRSTSTSSSSPASSPVAASPGSQGSGSEHSSFQWSPSGRRTGSLYCRVGIGFHLQIYPDGKVNGSHEASTLSILEIFAVSQGIVGIRGVFSNKFLAMSKKGKLHASRSYSYLCLLRTGICIALVWNQRSSASAFPVQGLQAKFTDDCKFRERFQENSYNTYASAIHRTEKTGREWYVALNKRGKAKRGCSPRVKPQHISTHFLPRFKQSEQPELSFTVTVPEKKKPPRPVKPKVPLSPPRRSPSPVKYRLKFRFG